MDLSDLPDEMLTWKAAPGALRQIIIVPNASSAARLQKQVGNARHTGILFVSPMQCVAGFRTQMIIISADTYHEASRHREFDRWFLSDLSARLTADGKVILLP
jgi:hypothetical protein